MLNIVLLGLVSFFSDVSSEMVYPLIPLYLTSAFGATPALVGVIEGIAESAASLLKVFSGYFTDKRNNKKPVAFFGYATGLVYKLALILASSWGGILTARVIDRVGKGVRTAPRDVLVSESADKSHMGKAFGIHKALDMAGSALGIFVSYMLLARSGGEFNYKRLFALSVIPAVAGLISMLFVKESKAPRANKEKERFWLNIKGLDRNLKLYLAIAFLFTLGNSSNTFLLLRAESVGFNATNTTLLYLIYNLTAALLSVPFGRLSDRLGRKSVLMAGYLTFSIVYSAFAYAKSPAVMVAAFITYGAYTAMTAGVERALIAEISPAGLKGTMLGLHATLVGIALLPASVIAGVMWNLVSAAAPFILGAGLSLAAFVMLFLLKESNSDLKAA